jgi:hypothetical protein
MTKKPKDDAPEDSFFVFTSDGVEREALMLRLNALVEQEDYEDAHWLMATAMGYDQLCAGVNESLGNAFKAEAQADGDRGDDSPVACVLDSRCVYRLDLTSVAHSVHCRLYRYDH